MDAQAFIALIGPAAQASAKIAEDAAQTTLMVVEFQRWYRKQARALAVD